MFRPLVVCARGDLIDYEQRLIDGLGTDYNVCPVAGNSLGYRHTEETKERMKSRPSSRGMAGKTHSQETRDRISKAKAGKPNVFAKGRAVPEEVREKIRRSLGTKMRGAAHPNFGKKYSDELRSKLSKAKLGKMNTGKSRRVVCIETGEEFPSSSEAARWLKSVGFSSACGPYVAAASRGKFQTAYGYTWQIK